MLKQFGKLVLKEVRRQSERTSRNLLQEKIHPVYLGSNGSNLINHCQYGSYNAVEASRFDADKIHGLDCLQFDMSTVDFNNSKDNAKGYERLEMINDVVKVDVESMKPHIVYIQHLQEAHYIMKLKMMLNRMGYESMFQPTHNGRGQATFIRQDIVPEHQESVFKSSMPDPSS